MPHEDALEQIAINVRSHRLCKQLLRENPPLEEILRNAKNETEALVGVRNWVLEALDERPHVVRYQQGKVRGRDALARLSWRDYAAVRLLDYVAHAGRRFTDTNLRGEVATSNPIKLVWLAVNQGTGGAKPTFFEDMLQLLRQFRGAAPRELPTRATVKEWMARYPAGLDPRIVKLREENRERIILRLIAKIDAGEIAHSGFGFEPGLSQRQKYLKMLEWWDDSRFQLKFAVRSPELLNELLGNSLDPDTMEVLLDARDAGIPFFVTPYYLSLLHVRVPYFAIGADLAIRHYVIYSRRLVDEFGHIVAWEKEDQVRPGQPNAAGWLLPSRHSIHRRYPDVAILIPDTMGRACGGLCAACQRMYEFQSGRLNFELDELVPRERWPQKLVRLLRYWEEDSQLRDILVTGGDALMSTDKSLRRILDAILVMARRKREANRTRPDGQKYAELQRVRLGTRLPAYLPQRVTPSLAAMLRDFKQRAQQLGVQQFVIQTHFESPLEVTPEARRAIRLLLEAGWTVTNQHVFTAAASRRGHACRLRQVLNRVGVLPYYTFSVKGYMENHSLFATNARALQEQVEERVFGRVPEEYNARVARFPATAAQMVEQIDDLREVSDLPFLATDRSVLNVPGVGKSLTYRVIGITRHGRRILEFEIDANRPHSPLVSRLHRTVIIESKSIAEYLRQLVEMGEEMEEYASIWGYSLGETEPRLPLYDYPRFPFRVTDKLTNLGLDHAARAPIPPAADKAAG